MNGSLTNQLDLMRSMSVPAAMPLAAKRLAMPGVAPTADAMDAQQAKDLQAVANQFEGLFMNMMLKSMRAVNRVFSEGNFLNSFESGMYEDMLDEKLSGEMASSHSLGIANLMMQQLGATPRPAHYDLPMGTPQQAAVVTAVPAYRTAAFASPEDFVADLQAQAEAAAASLGLPAKGLLAQAALETGWGQQVMHDGAGNNSHNLFGIKAKSDWAGESLAISSVEVRAGVVSKQVSQFKQYPSYTEAFADYGQMLLADERYSNVRNSGTSASGFAVAMGQSGYATDPDYGAKILRVLDHPALASRQLAQLVNEE
jgi:flagellar protein FlgJ